MNDSIQQERSFSGVRSGSVKYFILTLPVAVYFFTVSKYAVNIPSMDDYDAILRFLCHFKGAGGIHKFYLLFSQHNEHRILSSRLAYLLDYWICGSINFRTLILVANLQLLFCYVIFFIFIRRAFPINWFIPALIAGLCFFDLTNWENADFAMAAMQNYGVIFLFLLSMFLYSLKWKYAFVLAAIVQVIVTFSSGSGLVASFFVALYCLLHKDTISAYTGTGVLIVFAPLYFIKFKPVSHAPANIADTVAYFFHFASNHIYYDNPVIALIAGIAVFGILMFFLSSKMGTFLKGNMLPFVCITGFVLACMLLASVSRAGYGGYIPSRYLILSHLLFALVCIFLYDRMQNKRATLPGLIAVTAIVLVCYNINFHGGKKGFIQLSNTLQATDYYYPDKDAAKKITDEACRRKIYCIDEHRGR
jgi:hypothetical protein